MKRKLIRTSAVLLSIMLLVSGCGLSDPMYKNESSTTQGNTSTQIPSDSDNNSSGIQNPSGETSLAEDEKLGFQKTMNVSDVFRLNKMCKGSGGYYLENEGLLYYLKPESGRMIPVCSKPNCKHRDDNCNAWINSSMLTIYEDKLYFANSDGYGEGLRLFSMNLDGTGRKQIQNLESPLKSDNSTITFMSTASPILYNGMVYFKDGDRICTAKLGQDVSEAKVLMKESREGVQESHWKFWADEDTVYAMHRALTSEGYVDTLYRLNDSEAEKLWNSKILLELGAEDIILDGNAKWYINNGILYYYTSGGQVWKVELNGFENDDSGEAAKILQCTTPLLKDTDVGSGGIGLFTKDFIFILNEQKDSNTVSVYNYSGKFQQKLDLSEIFKLHSNTYCIELVFADNGKLYLLGSRGQEMSVQNNLYQLDLQNGSLKEIMDWPNSGSDYKEPETQHGEIG